MGSIHVRLARGKSQSPPIVAELEALFAAVPAEDLLTRLHGPSRRGPKGYNTQVLWRCYLAFYYLGLLSVSDLVRLLQDNPYIAGVCGLRDAIPSNATFSRFMSKLAKRFAGAAVKRVLWELSDRLARGLPNFGKSVAIDSTDIKGWSNGGKHHGASDKDAGWCAKANTEGNKKYVWGYKVHILTDTTHELPIAIDVTAGNVHDSKRATPLLRQARYALSSFGPRYFIADAAYSSDAIRKHIRRHYWPHGRCEAIIDPNPSHLKATAKTPKTAELATLFKRRTAAERVNSRLKAFRRLNHVRVRGRTKVAVHAMLSVIVMQAQALATHRARCVRRVG